MRLSTDTSSNAKLSSLANPTAPGVRTRTPTQTLADWTSALNQVVLSNRTETLAFLQQLSSGLAVDEDSADEVFNELIAKEAYGVFVEAFNAYCDILQSHADADGKPFTSRLVLRLPLGWLPRSLEVMRAALATLKVGCVEVHPPPVNFEDDFEREMYFAARHSNTPLERPISNGACQLVELLLQNGATELVVGGGSLEDLDRVRSAMVASSALQSLTLGKMRAAGLASFEYQGYLGLLETAQACPRLTQLTLHQSELLTRLEDGRVPHLPNLQSLTMRDGTAASSSALCAFLKSFSPSAPLTTVSLSFWEQENDMQLPTVLRSLKGHHSLTELALKGPSRRKQTCEDLIEALEAALTCPSMQSMTWNTLQDIVTETVWDLDVSPDLLERVRKIGQRLESPSCPLRSLSLRGFVIHETVLDILCEAIAKNKFLETLDLSGCGSGSGNRVRRVVRRPGEGHPSAQAKHEVDGAQQQWHDHHHDHGHHPDHDHHGGHAFEVSANPGAAPQSRQARRLSKEEGARAATAGAHRLNRFSAACWPVARPAGCAAPPAGRGPRWPVALRAPRPGR